MVVPNLPQTRKNRLDLFIFLLRCRYPPLVRRASFVQLAEFLMQAANRSTLLHDERFAPGNEAALAKANSLLRNKPTTRDSWPSKERRNS